jgi:adenosylcobalamin-dependent ribonucleoside-triphosphate reductase
VGSETCIRLRYRDRQKSERVKKTKYSFLSNEFLSKYKHRETPFPNQLGEFVYYRTYSRYLEEQGRREYWWETVARAVDYNIGLIPYKDKFVAIKEAEVLYENIFNLKQFLSGRTLFSGGSESSKSYGMSNYNCSFTIIDDFKAYKDMFYLLMVGAGVGFRVLQKDVDKLPSIRTDINVVHSQYVGKKKHQRQEYTSIIFTGDVAEIFIGDSKESFCDSLYKVLELHSDKKYRKVKNIIINYDNIRMKGERLKTFGGYASGHESMFIMLTKVVKILHQNPVNGSVWKRLSTIECMDIANIIGENVVSGGVRRTSEVCLFDANDEEVKQCKSNLYKQDEDGNWSIDKDIAHRRMSNNSIQYWAKPPRQQWHEHIQTMRYSGEPGLQNMVAAKLRREDAEGGNPLRA